MLKSEHTQHPFSYEHEYRSETQHSDKKYYSILPDLATGWRPKSMNIAAPILLSYQDTLTQRVFQHAQATMNKIVYIGPRHDNSYKFHSLTQHGYNVKYGIKCEQIPVKLQKELEEFTLKKNTRRNFFVGMNPSLEKELQFQSNFESGNLDYVLKVCNTEYNLFLRPDTNTCGHMQWFYFRVLNKNYGANKVRFNICNNKKSGVLYIRGMKPYVYSKHAEATRGIKWQQAGQNITYQKLVERPELLNMMVKMQDVQAEEMEKYYCLSFDYEFESANDEVFFSYCPPFTYTDMKNHLSSLKKRSNLVTEENLFTSLSGLEVPILTIAEHNNQQQAEKKCILITGRFHPGESNGSHVLKGFLEFLISAEGEELRKNNVFKIIPMVNPDGVVFGNYRTSLSGKDLNRMFRAKINDLFPEIYHIKNYIAKLKKDPFLKMVYFLDFHGHSIKKNIFLYGPEYDIWSSKFEKAKLLPKTIAAKTDTFRYQSCLFRIAAGKRTTARAFMLGYIPYCYTIESSVGLYRSFNLKQNFAFDVGKWEEAGKVIAESLQISLTKMERDIYCNPKKKKKIHKKQKKDENSNKQNIAKTQSTKEQTEKAKQKQIDTHRKSARFLDRRSFRETSKSIERSPSRQRIPTNASQSGRSQTKQQMMTTNLSYKPQRQTTTLLQFSFPQINEVDGESDGFSQGKSDCQSDDNDFDKEEYKKLCGKIKKFIDNFNVSVLGFRNKSYRPQNSKKVAVANTKKKPKLSLPKHTTEEMKMVPSLKHKMQAREASQKRIFLDEIDQGGLKSKKLSLYKFTEQKHP